MKIRNVTVIGANGNMGTNVATMFAAFGNAKVYMVSRDIEKSELAIERAVKIVRADGIRNNFIACDYSSLEKCIKDSDLIFESLSEDLETKFNINKEINKYCNDNTIISTGTSGLSIEKLSEAFDENNRKNYLGIHMFNPPYSLTACEIVKTKYTDKTMHKFILKYLSEELHRSIIEVDDNPAFLGNRIGFQFINLAMQYAEKYKAEGGIDYIDSILGGCIGHNMAPLSTANFVGLDVHKAIVDNVYENTNDFAHETFLMPEYANHLLTRVVTSAKKEGTLYKIELVDEKKITKVFDLNTQSYRIKNKYDFKYKKEMINQIKIGEYKKAFELLLKSKEKEAKICLYFALTYIIYSLNSAKITNSTYDYADNVMATGFNWCPPLAIIDALGGKEEVLKLIKENYDKEILKQINIDDLFELVHNSKYDFKKYILAK